MVGALRARLRARWDSAVEAWIARTTVCRSRINFRDGQLSDFDGVQLLVGSTKQSWYG